ncbi:hypothetical protein EVAR_14112_1 [Eumeta japonica]|uniref:Uncharacterized protein n=1 Tax=Eumeta variegata TaxID=151549 RepID=A0A4C1UNA2_EUMVA|nr:hypothetical protein EVAR_14112_1 [Eumeta japonica]
MKYALVHMERAPLRFLLYRTRPTGKKSRLGAVLELKAEQGVKLKKGPESDSKAESGSRLRTGLGANTSTETGSESKV